MSLANVFHRSVPRPSAPVTWPSATLTDGRLSVEGRVVGGFELAPVNLELMAESEREATLDALAALYDAVPRPFTLLSVPADRPRTSISARSRSGSQGVGRTTGSAHTRRCTDSWPPRRDVRCGAPS